MSIYSMVSQTNFYVPVEHVPKVLDVLPKETYDIITDSKGNIVDIALLDDMTEKGIDVLMKIAEYVRDGSYIECSECGSNWRYVFYEGSVYEIYPEVIWPEPNEADKIKPKMENKNED